jgi:hypothetical protein
MARRGFAILFTPLGVAFFISLVDFGLLCLAFGREPAVASNSTLVLRVGGDLTEVAPADVVSYVRASRRPRRGRSSRACARRRSMRAGAPSC